MSKAKKKPTIKDLMTELQGLRLDMRPKTMTYSDVAQYLQVSESTVRRMQKQPHFPRPKKKQTDENGSSITRFDSSEIIEWFKRDDINQAS